MSFDWAGDPFPARRILLGVTGSIEAVTVPQYIMLLRHVLGVEVRAVLTHQATTLVAPRAVAVACGHSVVLDDEEDATVVHLELTRWADLLLVLPATANMLARVAHGMADDLLTTCVLAAQCPVIFVPCMNDAMWFKPVVQRNVAVLEADGYGVVPPAEGVSAVDGKVGLGAVPNIITILEWTRDFLRQSQREAPAPEATGTR